MKRGLFAFYIEYCLRSPFSFGKGFLHRVIGRMGLTTYDRHGILMELNPSAWIDRTIVSGEDHDPFVGQTIQNALAAGGIFIDVGANIGVFTLMAAKLPGVLVYAFEPSPPELTRLYRNLALNQASNVIVFPMALGRARAQMDLALGWDGNPGSNSFVRGSERTASRGTVSCYCEALDNLVPESIAQRVRVVKIDVEGFEMEALQGMIKSISAMSEVTFIVEVTRSSLKRAGSSAEELYAFF